MIHEGNGISEKKITYLYFFCNDHNPHEWFKKQFIFHIYIFHLTSSKNGRKY